MSVTLERYREYLLDGERVVYMGRRGDRHLFLMDRGSSAPPVYLDDSELGRLKPLVRPR